MSELIPPTDNPGSADNSALWDRLSAFSFDSGLVDRRFADRLSSEQGWTDEFTARAIEEYRRFLFLTVAAGHSVCPSEVVDAVWHQHLTYSRSYWDVLCRDVLRVPLHHQPSTGGPEELRKHGAMYQQTLASYARHFDQVPPRDIWPPSWERFDPHSQPRQIDARDHWVIRKPTWWPRRSSTPGRSRLSGRALVMGVPVLAVGLGPFDWTGPPFLVFYAVSYFGLLGLSLAYRRRMWDQPETEDRPLSPEEMACLSFGRPAVVNATVAGMLSQQQVTAIAKRSWWGNLDGRQVKFASGPIPVPDDQPLARSIAEAVADSPRSLRELQQHLQVETEQVEQQLEDAGFLMDRERVWSARMVSGLLMASLVVVGFVKIGVGLMRDKPVEFLLIGTIVALITALAFAARMRLSRAGVQLVEALKAQHRDLADKVARRAATGPQVMTCAALFGAAALSEPIYEELRAAWKTTAVPGAGMTGGGCGSGCGGGGGAGGGCGGGGCGGCGGGS